MNKQPRILMVTHEYFPQIGGIATYVREMAKALHELGQNVEVWGPQGAGKGMQSEWKVVEMPGKGNQDFLQLWRLYRYLRSRAAELSGQVLWLVEPAPIRALALFGFDWLPKDCRVWVNFMGSELAQFKANRFWRGRVARLMDRVEKISFISEVIRDDYLAWREPGESSVVLTRCALRSDFQVEAVKAPLATTQRRVVLTISRIHPRKGQKLVIEALNRLPEPLRGQVEYWVVGSGRDQHRRDLERAAEQSTVPVIFKGRLHGEALGEAYAAGEVFVLTSLPDPKSIESFGIVYLEAAAYGKPVVAARVGGVHEAVRDGETGLIVEPSNAEAIANALQHLLEHPEQARAMGEAGKSWAKQFSWSDSARALLR